MAVIDFLVCGIDSSNSGSGFQLSGPTPRTVSHPKRRDRQWGSAIADPSRLIFIDWASVPAVFFDSHSEPMQDYNAVMKARHLDGSVRRRSATPV